MVKHFKEILIGTFIGVIITISLLAANYYSNIEKNVHYMEMYGYELQDGEWVKENE